MQKSFLSMEASMMDMISVIVPVYNIEKYIEKCVKSIMNQTYQNLQIILVDDGSTDASGEICDKLKTQDDRIEVIHKAWGGLSDARNYGVEKACGKYIAFVDGDDYIDEDMYEILYEVICRYHADIVSCSIYEEFQDKTNILCDNSDIIVLDRTETYKALFERKLGVSCCNKLFKREIFNDIRFKFGIQSEDLEFLYRAIERISRAVCVPNIKYHYCHRVGSITAKAFNKKSMDILYTLDLVMEFINQNYPLIKIQAYAYQAQYLLDSFQLLYKSGKLKEFREEKKFIEKDIRKHLKYYLSNKYIYWCDRYLLYSIALYMFPFASWLLEKGVKVKRKLGVRNK